MPTDPGKTPDRILGHYDASYGNFATRLYEEIRREAFGEDLGQNSWLTASELQKFMGWLRLASGERLLDVACGSGGPSLRLARLTGCDLVGVDVHEQAIANANALARREGLAQRATFERLDASQPLPWPAASFDAVMCIDAVNHLPDRRFVLAEWARVLKPGGRLVFTDPIVVTGALSHSEIAVRSSAGFYLFVPPGEDERLLRVAGLEIEIVEDVIDRMAEIAGRRRAARAARERELREIESDATYDGQQEFFRVSELIARERRLSRLAFLARMPQ
jgi:SAM-dependent methyltransferase